MILAAPNLLQSVLHSLRDPRGFARLLFTLGLAREQGWRLLMLVALMSVFINHLATLATVDFDTVPQDPMSAVVLMNARLLLANPFVHAATATSIMVLTVFAVYWVGRWRGGTGAFPEAILAVAWVGFVWSILAVVQLLTWFVSPALAALVGIGVSAGSLWVFTNLVAELHGFRSLFLTFIGMIATLFGVIFGLSFLITLIGVNLPGV